jgi:signal transduction histidine kinase
LKIPLKERVLSAAVVIPTAVVVVVLAVLQYSWSNQVSEATSMRLADSLQMSMVNWHLDLFRDFSQICLTLGSDPGGELNSDPNQIARSFHEWRAGAAYPDLISNLYIAKLDANESAGVLRFNASTNRFESGSWPASLTALREKLFHVSEAYVTGSDPAKAELGTPIQRDQFSNSFYPGAYVLGWRFDPSVPSLLHPEFSKGKLTQWLVIELDNHVLRERVMPDLAQRYFQGTDGLDFQVAIAGGKPRRVIYASDADFGDQEVSDADGTMDLFGRALDKASGSPVRVFHKPSENKGPATTAGASWFPLLSDSSEDEDWQLLVRHRRGGPMGAFAAELRRRDLTISFGVLFLLVLSMAMLVITSYRAQRLAKLQMDFVTTVSHELRTPLAVISTAADNISHGVVQGKQQLVQYGSVIGNQARQLSGLVEQILLFAATREGRQRYSPRLLQVREIIDAALANTGGLIRTAGFTVEQEIEPNLPPVIGDLAALAQCLQNLITNALKYGGEQRWFGIHAHLNEGATGSREIEISVIDRGIGIEAADLHHIFEPFYRSSSVTAAQIHGTGLGLPLAKSIAEAMQGQLTVASFPGKGSTFTLHLPCAEKALAGTGAEATPAVSPN